MSTRAKLSLMALVGLSLLTGCVMQVPAVVTTPVVAAPSTSWVEQLKLQIEQPTPGVRVASASPRSWHRVRLQLGRLDGSMPVMTKTIDPSDTDAMRRAFSNLIPGDGYFIQVSLIHLDAAGAEWEIGRGTLGGNGQSVRLNPGANAVPIPIKPMVAGGSIDAVPTALRRGTTRQGTFASSSSTTTIVVIDNGPTYEPYEPIVDSYEPALPDWDDYDPKQVDRSWDEPEESDDSESSNDSDDSFEETEDMGDFSDLMSAFQRTPLF